MGPDAGFVVQSCCASGGADGWRLSGSKPGEYESGLDANAVYEGHASGYLKSIDAVADGFGTLMQDINASHYAGKRVRITGS